ncbi:MAG: BlaI/MecI/CopY family transcriptional regulator [Candidatus Izemoplasmatales bacterium]
MKTTGITNSEWVLLRVLLNRSPLGSREIIANLPASNSWSTATVKTLLSRLVAKKIIGFYTVKNAFFYYPLVTEMEYVRSETKSLFAKIYGDFVVHETEHFRFSGGESKTFIVRLAESLESNYSRISGDLSFRPAEKHMVYVHSSFKVMQSALGYEHGPDWMTAGWFWEILHVAPEETFGNSSPEKAALHVLTQLLMHFVNPYAPFWLIEGVAVYEARWLTDDAIRKAMEIEKDRLDPYSVYRVPTDYGAFRRERGYEMACTVIRFIVARYGVEGLQAFLRAPEALGTLFHCSEGEFWGSWLEYLGQTYFGGGGRNS